MEHERISYKASPLSAVMAGGGATRKATKVLFVRMTHCNKWPSEISRAWPQAKL